MVARWVRLSAVLVLGSALIVAKLQRNGVTDGTVPLLHMGSPWGYTAARVKPLQGKVALVTGASSGLGLGVAKLLALRGASLTVTAREGKCAPTLALLRAHVQRHLVPSSDISCAVVELLDLPRPGTSLRAARHCP